MTATRKQRQPAAPLVPDPLPEEAPSKSRKPWIRRTPVEVVLDQIRKQEERVSELEEQFNREKRELQKLQKAKEVLEGK